MTHVISQPLTATTPGMPGGLWRPLLEGQLAERAHAATCAIADALQAALPIEYEPAAGLYAELALLYAYLARADVYPGKAIAEHFVDRAFDAVAAQRLSPALYGGFTGVGWAVAHLHNLQGSDAQDDSNEEID